MNNTIAKKIIAYAKGKREVLELMLVDFKLRRNAQSKMELEQNFKNGKLIVYLKSKKRATIKSKKDREMFAKKIENLEGSEMIKIGLFTPLEVTYKERIQNQNIQRWIEFKEIKRAS